MEESTRAATSLNNSVASTQVVVVRVKAPRMSYSDEVLCSLVGLPNVVGRTVDGGV